MKRNTTEKKMVDGYCANCVCKTLISRNDSNLISSLILFLTDSDAFLPLNLSAVILHYIGLVWHYVGNGCCC